MDLNNYNERVIQIAHIVKDKRGKVIGIVAHEAELDKEFRNELLTYSFNTSGVPFV